MLQSLQVRRLNYNAWQTSTVFNSPAFHLGECAGFQESAGLWNTLDTGLGNRENSASPP